MGRVVLQVKDLRTCYRTRLKENVYAVDGVSMTLEEGRVLGIAGESGCGKSTLALSLMGFYFPPLRFLGGQIIIEGTDIMTLSYEKLRKDFLGNRIAYIPQAAMNALNPTRKIINFIEDVLKEHWPDLSRPQIRALAQERFEILQLPVRALDSYPNELSGGMKQRVVITVSTILNPGILIADEPTSALDVSSQKTVIRMLLKLLENGYVKSIIFITHELPLLRHISDEIMVMYAGRIMEMGPADEVIFNPLHPYSKALMGAIIVPEEEMKGFKLTSIPGAPPNLKHRIDGCPFAQRCVYAVEQCRESLILPRHTGGREFSCFFDHEKLVGCYEN